MGRVVDASFVPVMAFRYEWGMKGGDGYGSAPSRPAALLERDNEDEGDEEDEDDGCGVMEMVDGL